MSNERLSAVSAEQQTRFLPLCHFVVELRSASDALSQRQAKVAEYMANGLELGWLIDQANRRVFVYRSPSDVQELDAPPVLAGEPALPGLRYRTDRLW